jgi:hypothetical protein
MIRFTSQGREQSIAPGETFVRARESGYRDTPAADLHDLIEEIKAGRPWLEAVTARYAEAKPWLYRIITATSRTAFFDLLPAGNGPVLDIGAGWGQIARPLARQRPVVALEPVAERLAFIRAAAAQDGLGANLAFMEADYFDIEFKTPLAAICVIGVLEWAGANQTEHDAQERQRMLLRKVRAELAPDGALLLGIENRLGLKYLLGCPDDHTGLAGIACLPAPAARTRFHTATGHALPSFTYSHPELQRMLHDAGFSRVDFFGAFPDYKLTEQIIPFGPEGRTLNEWLAGHPAPVEHDGYHGTTLADPFQTSLAANYRALAARGTAHHFVPSFFVSARP